MLKGFEDYTHELTPDERQFILPAMVKLLKLHAVNDSINNNTIRDTIRRYIDGKHGQRVKLTPARIRKIIQTLRKSPHWFPDHVLCSGGSGYFLSNDVERIKNETLSHLNSRINSQIETRDDIERQLNHIIEKRMFQKTIF